MVSIALVSQNPANVWYSDQGNKSAQQWNRANSKRCEAVHKQAGGETEAWRPQPTAALPTPTHGQSSSASPPSSPSIKGTRGGTCQLTLAVEHVEVTE